MSKKTSSPSAAEWLRRARREGTPLIDGERVTFLWRGRTAPQLIGDFMHWGRDGQPGLSPVRAAPGLWAATLTAPRTAYIEYAWFQDGHNLLDPLNPRRTANGLGGYQNFFYMPEAAPTPLLQRGRGVPRGTLTREVLPAAKLQIGNRRAVHFYQPATPDPSPLLIVFDGQDYLRRARLTTILDNLVAQRRMRPVAVAFVENAGPQNRIIEYACADTTLAFILYGVLPAARARLNLVDLAEQPGAYGALGASMGGVMALYLGLRAPHIFGRVLTQSGSFVLDGHPFVVWDLVRYEPRLPIHWWMDVGRSEWLLAANRQMRELAAPKAASLVYAEYEGGHNFTAWRDDLAHGLEASFPLIPLSGGTR